MKNESLARPALLPNNPCFSSGPCAKRPGWKPSVLNAALVGRSHRSGVGKERLAELLARSRDILDLPENYRIGIVPASDTGAVEMALWSLLGQRGVDVLAWESFGLGWVTDITKQLSLKDVRVIEAPYGQVPDFSQVDWTRDVVFTWNGTTSGVRVPHADWISEDREGLAICDGTSAVFAMEIPWTKLDVVTYSWQKVMGGEGQHGILILSPRAIERLENHNPSWPLPKIFRLTSGGRVIEGIFRGETINTPSMVCVEDALDGLKWAEEIGGKKALFERSNNNLRAIENWVYKTAWIGFLAETPEIRSNTSVCLSIIDQWFCNLSKDQKALIPKKIDALLESENVAYDINGYRDAPPGLRIWAGATISTQDLQKLFPWLEWAYASVKAELMELE
ncbi:MAG: phosphoserine transaminase [Pseudomonadota bacterium]|nr:phosphoserine transaminase [Pseudomonadota bacterium]